MRATDRDQSGQIRYRLVGQGVAPLFFQINRETGVISLRPDTDIKTDRTINYVVSETLTTSWLVLVKSSCMVSCLGLFLFTKQTHSVA